MNQKHDRALFISILLIILALACVDVLFTEAEPANGNTSDTFGHEKLDESKTHYLSLTLRQKFASPSFESQWEAMCVKYSKEAKRKTVIKRLKTLTSLIHIMGENVVCLQFFCERESKITLLKLIKGEQNFLNSFWSILFEPASLS